MTEFLSISCLCIILPFFILFFIQVIAAILAAFILLSISSGQRGTNILKKTGKRIVEEPVTNGENKKNLKGLFDLANTLELGLHNLINVKEDTFTAVVGFLINHSIRNLHTATAARDEKRKQVMLINLYNITISLQMYHHFKLAVPKLLTLYPGLPDLQVKLKRSDAPHSAEKLFQRMIQFFRTHSGVHLPVFYYDFKNDSVFAVY